MKKKSIFKRTIKYVTLTLLGIVILFNAAAFCSSCISDRPGRIIGRFMKVETGSMEPEIAEGDLVYVLRVGNASLSPGDAVTVLLDGKTVTHRLESVNGSQIVTRGLENESEDSPVAIGDYLGKVVLVIPGGAVVYETLTSFPVSLAAAAAFLLILLARPVAKMIAGKEKKPKIGATRVAAFAAAASMFLVPPASTLARYSGTLEGEKIISAAEVSFSSNYLSESGNTYEIVGWNGADYNSEIRISNYANSLKYNEEDVNVSYTIKIEKILSDGIKTYTDDYTLTLTPGTVEQTVNSDGTAVTRTAGELGGTENFTETLDEDSGRVITLQTGTYVLSGGILTSNIFMLTANAQSAQGSVSLGDGEQIKYRVSAETVNEEGFRQVLTAEYTMTATTAANFIERRIFVTEPGTQLVKLTMKTATLTGVTARKVVVEWDPEIMYLNEYEMTTMNMLSNHEMTLDSQTGYLEFNISASASFTLEFFKKSSKLTVPLSFTYETKKDADNKDYEYLKIFATPED